MARIPGTTDAMHEEYMEWIKTRPQVIQDMVEKYGLRMDTLYKIKSTGQRVVLYSFREDGTLTVAWIGDFDRVPFNTQIFGIDPADLEETNLPGEGEVLGEFCQTEKQKDAYIRRKRAEIELMKKQTRH